MVINATSFTFNDLGFIGAVSLIIYFDHVHILMGMN